MSAEPLVTPEATPDDVAALLTARTKDAAGRELGRWTDDTRPTAAQVQTRIDIARSLVDGPIPDACREKAEAVVALLAAMLTEAAFWPEQTTSPQSTYARLEEIYQQARGGLDECVMAASANGAYDLNVSGALVCDWPLDWWQRNLDLEP